MIKRTLYFGNPAYLSLSQKQLSVRLPEIQKNTNIPDSFKKEAVANIPIEDIGIVLLDHQQITITQGLLSALLENNTVVVACDSTHHPTGLFFPLSGNSVQNERYRAQLTASEPLKKQLWAQTIAQKIKNQQCHFQDLDLNNNLLKQLAQNVKSGDANNNEATAAAYYWQNIFKAKKFSIINSGINLPFFRRRDGDPPNALFNYGYAILRAVMARSVVSAGLLPTLGIHHSNRYNAFCLADDLMEPYRPYVDRVVCNLICSHGVSETLTKEQKTILLSIPAIDVVIDKENSPLMIATQRTAVSLVKCFEGTQKKLAYPDWDS